jgi:hypothetical protein
MVWKGEDALKQSRAMRTAIGRGETYPRDEVVESIRTLQVIGRALEELKKGRWGNDIPDYLPTNLGLEASYLADRARIRFF